MNLSIRDVLKIKTPSELEQAFGKFDHEIEGEIGELQEALDSNMLGVDFSNLTKHMWLVSSFQGRLVQYLSLANAFYDHARGASFLLPKSKDYTELDREANFRELAAGWGAWKVRLEGLSKASESRINLVKKLMGLETTSHG